MLRTTLTSLALLASLTYAQSGLPSCASSCVGTSFGSCGSLDVKCICSDTSLIANLACCVSTACSASDQEATIKFADALCQGQGVTNLPKTATCASTSGSSSTGTQSGATSTSQDSSTMTGTMTMTGTESTMTMTGSSASASLSSALSSVSSEASSASKSASASASSASASVTSAAGAAMVTQMGSVGFGAVLAGVLAVL